MKGTEFKDIREQLGLSQDELADVLCLSGKQAVSNIETEFRNPSKLTAVLMRVFATLSQRRSKELRELLLSLSKKERSSREESK
jgi:DNA-binding transcriptional regulator YiaG